MYKPFGVVPLSPLMIYVGAPTVNDYIQDSLLGINEFRVWMSEFH